MKKLSLFLLLISVYPGCSDFGCSDLFECEEILTDFIEVRLIQDGQRLDVVRLATKQNGDSIVVDHTLPDCPAAPRILPDTLTFSVFEARTRQLLDKQSLQTTQNGQHLRAESLVQVPADTIIMPPDTVKLPPDTVTVSTPTPIVDERYVIGPGKHSAARLKLVNYIADDSNDSEFGQNAELYKELGEGQIEAWFRGTAGRYGFRIKVENDQGITNEYALQVNGKEIESWTFTGSSKDTQEIVQAEVQLPEIAWIEIRAKAAARKNSGEIDWIEVVER